MMEQVIREFHKQFAWEPKVEGGDLLMRQGSFIAAGMGGSHLAADLLRLGSPYLDLCVHKEYGLPQLSDPELRKHFVIAISYSGNTEETIDAFEAAVKRDVKAAAIATGGKLLVVARARRVPFVKLPETGIQPRMALGYMLKALMKVIGDEKSLRDVTKLSETLDPGSFESKGKELADRLAGRIPVIYTSSANGAIAQVWKIKLNEGAKIPAFWNVFPELNHNEMTGFDRNAKTLSLSEKIHFVFLRDDQDHKRISRRMEVTQEMLEARGFSVENVPITGASRWERIFSSLLIADWASLYLARAYGTEPEQVPMVEEFKKKI